jgi:predicted nucleotidyltransferase
MKRAYGADVDITKEQIATIEQWAAKTPYVLEVRLHGSRAKGTSGPDSDIDLALTLGGDPWIALANYYALGQQWQDAVTAALNAPAHIGLYNDPESAIVRTSCDHCCVLLFQRNDGRA